MTSHYIDFDEAWAEHRPEPLPLHTPWGDYELPGSIPASLMLQIVRMQGAGGDDAEMTSGDVLRLLIAILPQDILDELTSHADFSAEDLIKLLGMVMGEYTGGSEGGSGKATAPAKAARKSSSRAGA